MILEELRAKRALAVVAMGEIVAKAEKEDRGLTVEERESWDKSEKDVTSMDERIEITKRSEKLAEGLNELVGDIPRPGALGGEGDYDDDGKKSKEQYRAAFEKFGTYGMVELTAEERNVLRTGEVKLSKEERAQSVGTTTGGGFLVPEGFSGFIETALLMFSGIRNVATIVPTDTGNVLPFPTNNDTGNSGALLAENTADSEQDLTFGELQLDAYRYTSKIIRVSLELMQDSAFSMDAYIGARFGERLGRITSTHYATGTGSGQPNGLFTAAVSGKTAAAVAAVTYSELLDLKHSVDPAYRQNARWVFNDATLKALKQLLDADGRPLWSPRIDSDVPALLDGDPYQIDQGSPAMTTGLTPIAYGDMSKYLIRDVRGFSMVRLSERYAEFHQAGFIAFMRTDGDLLDAGTNPVKKLTMA